MAEPTEYTEWHSRRNNLATSLCSALSRSRGEVCGCKNGGEHPDAVYFDNCRKMVETADKALAEIGVPVPPKADAQKQVMTLADVADWLEKKAIHYETANNAAMKSDRYKREDHVCWQMAQVVRIVGQP